MSNPIFRQSALQNLSSPEQLDQLIKITRPRSWIVLAAIGLILVATGLWSYFGTLSTTLAGEGLIIRSGGNSSVVAIGSGEVTEFGDFKPGDMIHKNDIIGHVSQPLLAQQIDAARIELDRLEKENRNILAEIDEEKPMQNNSIKQQMEIQQATIYAKEDALHSHKLTLQQQELLLKDGLITRQQYEQTRQLIFTAQNEIGVTHNALQNLTIQTVTNNGIHEERIRQSNASLLHAKNQLQDLQVQYDLATKLISQHDGLVVEKLTSLGSIVSSNQAVLTLESSIKKYQAIIYMPTRSASKRIKPGMDAQIELATRKKEQWGFLKGKVLSVSQFLVSEQAMMAVIHNQGLVSELYKAGPPRAVTIELSIDPTTASGYQWSSKAGGKVVFNTVSGNFCIGSVIIEKQKPISLVIPFLKQLAGL